MRSFDRRTFNRTMLGVVAGLALVAAGCGAIRLVEHSPRHDGPSTDTRPWTTEATGHDAIRPPLRARIDPTGPGQRPRGPAAHRVALPTHTEMLFAIGAGDQVVAVDDQSELPGRGAAKPHDLSGYEPNVEAIAGYEPDLVRDRRDDHRPRRQLEPARHRRAGSARRR